MFHSGAKQFMRDYLTELLTEGIQGVDYLKEVVLPENLIERPKMAAHGDYASNVALVLAGQVHRSPQDIAQDIVAHLRPDRARVDEVDVVPPGFINFRVTKEWLWTSLRGVLEQGAAYGRSDRGRGGKVQLEFVSANPTGPLNVVSARAAAVGDVLANLLASVGYEVEREYYINDAGRQMDLLTESVYVVYHRLLGIEKPMPEDGYHGAYIEDVAKSILNEESEKYVEKDDNERRALFRPLILARVLKNQRKTLEQFRVGYDVWFSEKELRESGALDRVLARLSEGGYIYDRDGATWFTSTGFGDEKDRVLVMSDGRPTYFLSDIAYHQNKFERGFEWVIDLWGPDHHGARMHFPAEQDRVRTMKGTSRFKMRLDPSNLGVMLRRKFDYLYPNQRAKVWVRPDKPGAAWKYVGQWYTAGSNTCVYSYPRSEGELGKTQHTIITGNRRWREEEFLVPRHLTEGVKRLAIKIQHVPNTMAV